MESITCKAVIWGWIKSCLGKSYIYGGDHYLEGYDCSGFVLEILRMSGMINKAFDTTAAGLKTHLLQNNGALQTGPNQFGNMVFYKNNLNNIDHVAFSVNNFFIVEAAGGDSNTKSYEAARLAGAYVRFRPWNYRTVDSVVVPNYPFTL